MAVVKVLLQFLGALAFLLYGMKLMSDGVQKSTGEKLQRALSVMTGNRIVALITGMVVTMIIQSSGATTVMVVTFVNAGLLSLVQSVGVIFGANIGTTITAWIVSLSTFDFKIGMPEQRRVNFVLMSLIPELFSKYVFIELLYSV